MSFTVDYYNIAVQDRIVLGSEIGPTGDAANPLEIKPYQNIEYDGHYWMVIAMDVDLMANSWRLELARLGEIGS